MLHSAACTTFCRVASHARASSHFWHFNFVDWRVCVPCSELCATSDSLHCSHVTHDLTCVLPWVRGADDTVIGEDDSEVVALIKELLDTRIRPAVQV